MVSTVDDFLRLVLKSGVVERERLQSALRTVPMAERGAPKSIADNLVANKLLTPFQAQKLLAGVSVGLKLGPYIIQTPIGKGGMGTVYLAKDSRTDLPAAIKVVSPKRVQEGQRHLARFQREMVLSQKLQHPNVALTKDVGEVQGVHYLALEYIPGVTLHRLVTRDGPLAPPRAARLFAEVCAALDHAHSQGLIHRDMKPTNIMVTPDDHAKVLDLGLALMEGEVVDDPEVVGGKGYIVGSVEYIAPEQTHDPTQVDARADLYSLGCTLYFALSGKPPFTAGDAKDKVRAHRHQAPEPIRRRNPAVPEGLAGIVHRLMAKDVSLRPPAAALVRQELLAFSEISSPPAQPTDTALPFQLEDFSIDDAPDTLSEVFQLDSQVEEAPTIARRGAPSAVQDHGMMWLVLAAVAIGVASLTFFVLMARMR
jgi:serine/threonine protein kinase